MIDCHTHVGEARRARSNKPKTAADPGNGGCACHATYKMCVRSASVLHEFAAGELLECLDGLLWVGH